MSETNISRIRSIYYKFIAAMSAMGSVWTFVLMFVIVIDVLGRFLFNAPLTGTSEIIRNSIVGITFLQLAQVLKVDRHIQTTLITDRVSPTMRQVLKIFAYVLGAVLMILIIMSDWGATWDALAKGDYEGEGALRVPTFPVHFLILFGSFFLLIQFIVSFFDTLLNLMTKKDSNEEV